MKTTSWFGFRANADNLPLPLPGAYRITNLANGKPYVGIAQSVSLRCGGHAKHRSPKKFRAALDKYGNESFLVEPMFYWLDGEHDKLELARIEAEMIRDNDAVRNGYNVKEAEGNVGPYGPEYNEIMKISQRARRAKERENPQPPSPKIQEAAAKRTAEHPTWHDNLVAAGQRSRDDPVWRANQLAARQARSAREREWSNMTGEPIAWARNGGLAGGRNGALAQRARMTPEELHAMSSRGGTSVHRERDDRGVSVHASNMGRASMAKVPLEERRERGRRVGKHPRTPETRERMRLAAICREAKRREERIAQLQPRVRGKNNG